MIYCDNKVINEHIANVVFEAMNAIPAQERFDFKRKADKTLAPKGNAMDQAKVANVLYRDILKEATRVSKNPMTTYSIAMKTKGDITKMPDWDTTVKCNNALMHAFTSGKPDPYYSTLSKMDKMMTACKKDFEYGFKYDIEIIKILYGYMVEAYYELMNIIILNYSIPMTFPATRMSNNPMYYNDTTVYKSCNTILDLYESGEWKKLMNSLKNSKVAAAESFAFDGSTGNFAIATVNDDPFAVLEGDIIDTVIDFAKVGVVVVGVVVTLFFAIRSLIAYFFRKMSSYKNNLENQATLLDTIAKTDSSLTPEQKEVIERRRDKMQAKAAEISRKIFKADKEAKEEMKEEAKKFAKAIKDPTYTDAPVGGTPNPDNTGTDSDFVIL